MRKTYVQYTPILPLNLLGRIDAAVTSDTTPDRPDQVEMDEGTETTGLVVNLLTLSLVLP